MNARWVMALALVVSGACKKEKAASPPAPGSAASTAARSDATMQVAAGDAGTIDAATVAGDIELLHAVAATVRVSSQVHNKTILPSHIVDRSMQTAWNSKTGELVGAWVDVTVQPGSHIHEIRLTVGHTGKGKRGEDYFTMNPRIASVHLIVDGKPEQTVTLDPSKRELQPIKVDAAAHVRIVVAEIKAGTKKTWREAAISELEVWGTPPAGWTAQREPLEPMVLVGDEPYIDPCKDLDARMAQWEEASKASVAGCEAIENPDERERCGIDGPGPPSCSNEPVKVDKLAPPWLEVALQLVVQDSIYGPTDATLTAVTVDGKSITVDNVQLDWGNETLEVDQAEVFDVIAGGPPELVLRFHPSHWEKPGQLVVCRAAPSLACSTPLTVAGEDWSADIAFRRGAADVSTGSGTPPPEVLGEKVLVFP